jgi:hypothetical protein
MSLKTVIDDSQAAIEADPSNAAATFATSGRLVGPTEVSLTARGHEITVDEPAALAGTDHGANPIEHVLIAWPPARRSPISSGRRSWASNSTTSRSMPRGTSMSAGSSDSTTPSGPAWARSGFASS